MSTITTCICCGKVHADHETVLASRGNRVAFVCDECARGYNDMPLTETLQVITTRGTMASNGYKYGCVFHLAAPVNVRQRAELSAFGWRVTSDGWVVAPRLASLKPLPKKLQTLESVGIQFDIADVAISNPAFVGNKDVLKNALENAGVNAIVYDGYIEFPHAYNTGMFVDDVKFFRAVCDMLQTHILAYIGSDYETLLRKLNIFKNAVARKYAKRYDHKLK